MGGTYNPCTICLHHKSAQTMFLKSSKWIEKVSGELEMKRHTMKTSKYSH